MLRTGKCDKGASRTYNHTKENLIKSWQDIFAELKVSPFNLNKHLVPGDTKSVYNAPSTKNLQRIVEDCNIWDLWTVILLRGTEVFPESHISESSFQHSRIFHNILHSLLPESRKHSSMHTSGVINLQDDIIYLPTVLFDYGAIQSNYIDEEFVKKNIVHLDNDLSVIQSSLETILQNYNWHEYWRSHFHLSIVHRESMKLQSIALLCLCQEQ